MYYLTLGVEQTLAGLRFGARLYDIGDNGASVLVATHGPLLRELADERVEDLHDLLVAAERYISLLEYSQNTTGGLEEFLF